MNENASPWGKLLLSSLEKPEVGIEKIRKRWKQTNSESMGFGQFLKEFSENKVLASCDCRGGCSGNSAISLFLMFCRIPKGKLDFGKYLSSSFLGCEDFVSSGIMLSSILSYFQRITDAVDKKEMEIEKEKENDKMMFVKSKLTKESNDADGLDLVEPKRGKYFLSLGELEVIFHKFFKLINANFVDSKYEIDAENISAFVFHKLKESIEVDDNEEVEKVRMCLTMRILLGVVFLLSVLLSMDEEKKGIVKKQFLSDYLLKITKFKKGKAEKLLKFFIGNLDSKEYNGLFTYELITKMIILIELKKLNK